MPLTGKLWIQTMALPIRIWCMVSTQFKTMKKILTLKISSTKQHKLTQTMNNLNDWLYLREYLELQDRFQRLGQGLHKCKHQLKKDLLLLAMVWFKDKVRLKQVKTSLNRGKDDLVSQLYRTLGLLQEDRNVERKPVLSQRNKLSKWQCQPQ